VVDATEHILGMADRFHPFRVDLGRAGERRFTFAAGIGLDASVVQRVDARPRLKARFGEWFFTYAALVSFTRRYLVRPPRVRAEIGDSVVDGVTVVVQNSDPYTYFGRRPIRVCEGADSINGRLAAAVLKRATPLEIPTLIPRIFANRAGAVTRHRQVTGFRDLRQLRVISTGESGFPLQVDGDYVGEFDEVEFGISPAALAVVS
jgi:diacylglycerol kinase family enzyme